MLTSYLRRIALLLVAAVLAAGCAVADDRTGDTTTAADELAAGPRFELWKDAGAFWFHFLSADGELLLASDGYTTRTGALNGLLSVLDNGGIDARYRVAATSDGGTVLELTAANRAVIAASERHDDEASARAAIAPTVQAVGAYRRPWERTSGARFALREAADGWRWDLHARNGEAVLHSQAYGSRAAALNGAFSVADHGADARRYRVVSRDGGWAFELVAANGQVIGESQVYVSKWNAERGRDAVIALVPDVPLL